MIKGNFSRKEVNCCWESFQVKKIFMEFCCQIAKMIQDNKEKCNSYRNDVYYFGVLS